VAKGEQGEGADPEALVARAADLLVRGERVAARALLESMLDLSPPLSRAWRCEVLGRLAALEEGQGNVEEAARRWQAVLAEDIDHDVAWANLRRIKAAFTPAASPDDAAPRPVVAAPTLDSGAGVDIQRFEILGELGRGAFATVYRARDRTLGLPLALKVLHPRTGADPEQSQRRDQIFFNEARRVAALRHPGIVAFYDIDPRARTLVMELIAGGTLRDRLRGPGRALVPLPPPQLVPFARRLLEALLHVHAQGIVHGDLSPRNVLLRRPDQPVLIDFGSPHLGDHDEGPAGTPLYLAPEQFQGAGVSAAADLFAAGTVLWEAAFGRPMRTREDLIAGRTAPPPLPPVSPSPELHPLLAALVLPPGQRAAATALALANLPAGATIG
jgi:tRNA A-37 threonylcarbamoyl transferase component Bud32